MLGVAPLGASSAATEITSLRTTTSTYKSPREALVARDGKYEVRITEELSEVAYLDQVKLIAVDHPKEVEIFTNEKFQGPPFPTSRLFGVRQRVHPIAAQSQELMSCRSSSRRTDATPTGSAATTQA